MNNQENKNNKQVQDPGHEGSSQNTAKPKNFFAKRWTFPVIYLAASVLIVGLMYAKSQDTAPYQVEKTPDAGVTENAGPTVPGGEAAAANATPNFMWPVGEGGGDAVVSMDFYRDDASDAEKAEALTVFENSYVPNQGVNLGLQTDATFGVVAAAKGTVTSVTEDPLMGQVVEIDHGNGYSTYYASLSNVQVEKGANVLQGQEIAKSGNNRFEKDEKNHLHFEVRKDGKQIDPNSVLPKKPHGDAKSTDAKPKEATTQEDNKGTAPAQDGKDQNQPNESKETNKPAEQTPSEQKPAEQKPAEQKPAEQKPSEQKPAEKKDSPADANMQDNAPTGSAQ